MKNAIDLRQKAWFGDTRVTFPFPENWDVHLYSPPEMDALTEQEIREKIASPPGVSGLDSQIHSGNRVLIICDDISRPTPTDLILPLLLDILQNKGVKKENISILISSGTHDLMTSEEVAVKLGREIASEYRVHLHHSRKGNVLIGRTSRGTPVYVNRQIVKHDMIIGVGGIVPHNPAGFGGGEKLILGVCGIRTILHFHQRRKGTGTGGDINNEFRMDVQEASQLAGLGYIVNTVVNRHREVVDVFAGDPDLAFRTGVKGVRKHFGVPHPDTMKFDLVIADVYPFDASFAFTRKGWWPVMNVTQECHKLIISSMPKGVGGHLVFPIPNDHKINKLIRLYLELVTFGMRSFINKSLAFRIRKLLRKQGLLKNKPLKISASRESGEARPRVLPGAEVPGRDVVYLHSAEGKAASSLLRLPNVLFNSSQEYVEYICELTGYKPLSVAFYRASALTFPEYS